MPFFKNNQANQSATKSPKSNKKNEKCKRSLSKTNSKLSISDLLKSNVKENQTKESNSAINNSNNNNNNNNNNCNNNNSQNINNFHHSNIGGSSSSSCSSGGHNSGNGNNNNLKPSTNKPPTKVKSGSWKRSEKQISSYNTISGKKSKSLRKRSPTWLKFPNSPVKIAEKVSYVGTNDTTSVCRPGTLYSDVLFGAGSSCLVKIKTLTPRRNTNNAQKKLTKALIKSCKSNENETASGSDTETDRELFPSLNEFNKSPNTTIPSLNDTNAENLKTSFTKIDDDDDVGVGSNTTDDGADVVILSESSGIQNSENGFNDVSYGSYLEHHFSQINGDRKPTTDTDNPQTSGKPFRIDIPQWNFMDADISSEAYPKFLCQFEDEHYLKAEKMALLGLKLALGNNTNQGKFKF